MLDTGGAGIEAFRLGFSDAFPEESQSREFPKLELGGATDGGLVDFLFKAYDLVWSAESQAAFYQAYLNRLESALKEAYQSKRARQLPGINELLNHFDNSNHCLGLLTGNIERAAFLKLDCFDYPSALFKIGAYGDDDSDRNKLGPIATQRAVETYRQSFAEDEVYILGDTLKDIACARACGAKVIAVATGACDYETLKSAKPDYLFEDLADTELVLKTTDLS